MTLFEYSCTEGFREILDFAWEPAIVEGEPDQFVFERLGYRDQELGLYSSDFSYWVAVYKNMADNEYDFIIRVSNHLYGQYIACRTFADYMDFLARVLPVIKTVNDIAIQTAITGNGSAVRTGHA